MTDSELRSILSDRFASICSRIAAACERAGRDPNSVTLVAVTKTISPQVAAINTELGTRDLGENRPQSLWAKAAAIRNVRWHLIGHLQRNKIERTIPLVTLVHSVDSLRVLEALDAFGRKRGQAVPLLLEVNCSRDEKKGGFRPEEVESLATPINTFEGVEVRGLMTMASYFDDPQLCRPAFAELRTIRDSLQKLTGKTLPELSMGMSNDFEVAIEEGATFVRIGTTLFEGLVE
jgi:PLP dependent protein